MRARTTNSTALGNATVGTLVVSSPTAWGAFGLGSTLGFGAFGVGVGNASVTFTCNRPAYIGTPPTQPTTYPGTPPP